MEEKKIEIGSIRFAYHSVRPGERAEYDGWLGNLTKESFLEDMGRASKDFLQAASMVLSVRDPRTNKHDLFDLEIDTYTPENFFLYAVEGNPRFLKRYTDGSLREINEDEVTNMDFGLDLSTFISFNELFTCLEESIGRAEPAYSMYAVLNMFCARIKLDVSEIIGEQTYLSIHELALLAGMKEKSVRNLAYKGIGAVRSTDGERTLVSAQDALAWLKGRRKFIPSERLSTEAARQALVSIHYDFF
jgi:hypothetical protein